MFLLAANAAFRADYFQTKEILNKCINDWNQADFLYQLIKLIS